MGYYERGLLLTPYPVEGGEKGYFFTYIFYGCIFYDCI